MILRQQNVFVYLDSEVLIVEQVIQLPIGTSFVRTFASCFSLRAQCTGFSTLFCYNGGCPTAGRDAEINCICKDPFTGPDCSQMACSHSAVTCYNGGECIDGESCKCPPGYGGIDCRGGQS